MMVQQKVAQARRKTRLVFRVAGWAAALGWLWGVPAAPAAPASGEAIVAAMTGHAEARVFTAPVHEGRTDLRQLFEGAALHENSRVITGKDGRLCMVMSPGAIVCVAPQSQFQIEQLRHTAAGLPRTADDIIRRIHLNLERGRIRVHAGAPLPTLDIRVVTPAGVIEAHGGEFVVAEGESGQWLVFCHAGELTLTPRGGEPVTLGAGNNARLTLAGERAELQTTGVPNDPARESFELCNVFFSDLEPFIEHPLDFDREGLGNYLGLNAPFQDVDDGALVTDASPTIRPAVAGAQPTRLPRAGENAPGARWGERRIWDWYNRLGVVKGVNYIPRTAVNSVEMWQEATFDPDTIDQELGWAHDVGYTSIRVQLQFAVWQADPDGFLKRVDKLLELAAKHGLRVVPVLFDDLDVAGRAPVSGPQPEPVPGEYNSQWVPSPAHAMVTDRQQWPALEKYVKDVMGRFKRDGRVLYWDLYNTAGNSGLWEESLPLLDQTFNWARSVEATQPLAVAAWKEFGSAMAARKLERSDLITFQSYDTKEAVEARLMLLQQYKRPIICSGWLMRQSGNQFDQILPLFAMGHVGWFNQGLVAGRTQLEVQQTGFRSESDPDLWQQNVLREDGTPYDRREVELIQGFQFVETPE
ncbi:MAG TPA: FecR domain-containing protein [Kiritimatiellia bacterium]|nr:FecR domain-containing protein [Kiritimatiellia bacterium]HQG73989.1 FecR domain-containing protein [Kiritimatiellia bacterium]HQM22648.1 FecR domain-containing protein [Kiritimatiellia bacterium]